RPVGGHRLVAQRGDDGAGEDRLHEHVPLEDELLALPRSAEALEDAAGVLRPLLPGQRPDDRLEEGEAGHTVGMAGGPVEPEGTAPIVADDRDVPQVEGVEPGVQITGVVGEVVGDRRLAGAAHADETGRQAAALAASPGMTLRHRYEEVGLPWRRTIGRP